MNNRWNRFLSLLLALCTVLTMIPAAFALETTETLPEETETGVEEAVTAEEPDAQAAEPAAVAAEEAPAVEAPTPETPAEESASEPMTVAVEALPGTSQTEHPYFDYSGSFNCAAADELRRLINQELPSTASSYLTMSYDGLSAAMSMAAESVYGTDAARPNGEDWLTLAGDNDMAIDTSNYALELLVTEGASAQEALEELIVSDSPALSGEYKYTGIGSFTLPGGHTYWAIFLFNAEYEEGASIPADTVANMRLFYSPSAWTGQLQFGLTSTAISQGATASADVTITNGIDSQTPSADQLVYSSSNTKVLTVDTKGNISAVGSGTATVSVHLAGCAVTAVSTTLTSSLDLSAPVLKSVSNTNTGIKVTWSAVPSATHYAVYRSLKSGNFSGSTKVGTCTAPTTSFEDKTAADGVTYCYTVRADYISGDTTTYGSFDRNGLTIHRLAAPTLVSATADTDGITFTWKSVTGAGGYTVWRKDPKNTSWKKIATVDSAATSYVDTDVTKGTKYTYTVRAYKDSTLSAYNTTGKSATAGASVTLESYVVTQKIYYRTGAGTSYDTAGTLQAGAKIDVITGWSKTANGAAWYKFKLNGNVYYVMAQYLLRTPKISSVTNTADGLKISWNKVDNAAGYALYRKESSTSWKRVATISSGTTTSYTDADKNLTSGTTYYYTVRPTKGSVMGGYDNAGTSRLYAKAPELVSAAAGSNQITFTWSAVKGASKYTVYRKVNNGGWKSITTVTGTSFVDNDVTSLSQYTYTVRARVGSELSYYNTTGLACIYLPSTALASTVVLNKTSYRTGAGDSYKAVGTYNAGTQIQAVAADLNSSSTTWCRVLVSNSSGDHWYYVAKSDLLLTPVLKSAAVKANGIQVSWNKVANAAGYVVYRRLYGSSSWARIATLDSAASVSYTDTSVAPGSTYFYTVRASANSGNILSRYDNTGVGTTFLSVPTLTGASASASGIKVTWGTVDGATGYYVYRKPVNGSWARVAVISNTYYNDTSDLIQGTTYVYTVRAYCSNGALSEYDRTGVSAVAAKTLNPATVKYKVTANNTPYYVLTNGQVLAAGKKGTLDKGDAVYVVSGMSVVEDGYTEGLTYTPILMDNTIYYIATSRIEKA